MEMVLVLFTLIFFLLCYVSVRRMLLLAMCKIPSPCSVPLSFLCVLSTHGDGHCKYSLGLVSVSPRSCNFQYSMWWDHQCTPKLNSQPKFISLQHRDVLGKIRIKRQYETSSLPKTRNYTMKA